MTGPVTTEALVAALADYWRIARRWPLSTASDIARDLVAGPLAPLLAALQQVTAEREARGEVIASLVDELARLRAEGEAKDRDNAATALMVIALCNSVLGNAYLGKDGEEDLAGHVKAAFTKPALARAATAREGQSHALDR